MEAASPPTAGKEQFKLRWYQYRLRSLFLLTLLVAIGMSYIATMMQNQRRQKAAAVAIQKARGWARCEQSWLGRLLRDDSLVNVTRVELAGHSIPHGNSIPDALLVHLDALSQLESLNVHSSKVSDTGLAHLEGLSRLRWLDLGDTGVGDAGLAHLRGLSHLEELCLSGTQVTDAGLAHLEGLSRLKCLHLGHTGIGDAGLVHVQRLSQLEVLYLDGTQVTDAGLVHLRKLRRLTRLDLEGCEVSRKDEWILSCVIPGCDVIIHKRRGEGPDEGTVFGTCFKNGTLGEVVVY